MSKTNTLKALQGADMLLTGILNMAMSYQKYNAIVQQAISEGRDVTDEELAELTSAADAARERAEAARPKV